jgi:hypothetical protein
MICRGHLPVRRGGEGSPVNRDVEPFIRYFLPQGATVNRSSLGKAARHFHLAFKNMEVEEIYDILMEQLIAAINGYDPCYKAKVKQVVEVIQREFTKQRKFSAALVGLVSLKRYREREQARKEGVAFRRGAAWPPPAGYLAGTPIGVAYYVQKWFRFNLQQWITSRMRELESNEGVYSLEGWQDFQKA